MTIADSIATIRAITADACTCDELAVKPNNLAHAGTEPTSLQEIAARAGRMPDGDELVGAHPTRPGATYSLRTDADPDYVFVVRSQKAARTGDSVGFTDAALSYAANVVRNRQAQALAYPLT